MKHNPPRHFDPDRSELSQASLEDLLISIGNLRAKDGRPLNVKPTRWIFTEEALRKFFGWTDEDFAQTLPNELPAWRLVHHYTATHWGSEGLEIPHRRYFLQYQDSSGQWHTVPVVELDSLSIAEQAEIARAYRS